MPALFLFKDIEHLFTVQNFSLFFPHRAAFTAECSPISAKLPPFAIKAIFALKMQQRELSGILRAPFLTARSAHLAPKSRYSLQMVKILPKLVSIPLQMLLCASEISEKRCDGEFYLARIGR